MGMKRIFGYFMAAIVLTGLAGCKPKTTSQTHPDINSQPAHTRRSIPLDPATLGSVSGTVHFAGKPPERIRIDMSQDPACSMTGGENLAEQYVVHDGKLANVYIYVKSGPAAAMSASDNSTAPVVLDQVGCRYVPHVIAVMQGGSVEFRNSDDTMHNIHTMPTVSANKEIDVSQGPKGAPQIRQFLQPEVMMPVRCNNHPWMNAFINVSATPFFAVTDANGRFEINGLPAGTYTLAAVHEKMGEQTITVTVKPHETEPASFTYSLQK